MTKVTRSQKLPCSSSPAATNLKTEIYLFVVFRAAERARECLQKFMDEFKHAPDAINAHTNRVVEKSGHKRRSRGQTQRDRRRDRVMLLY